MIKIPIITARTKRSCIPLEMPMRGIKMKLVENEPIILPKVLNAYTRPTAVPTLLYFLAISAITRGNIIPRKKVGARRIKNTAPSSREIKRIQLLLDRVLRC